jgi:hypothetical protein
LVIICFPVLFHQIEQIAGARSLRQLFSGILQSIVPIVHAANTGSSPGMVDTAGHVVLTVLAMVAGSAALVVVWLLGHSVDVLLLLSPFPFLDVVLKGLRVGVFALVVGTSLISRGAGLALSLLLIVICAFCAGWAFRLALFGSVLAWDLLRTVILGLKRTPDVDGGIRCFCVGRRLGIRKRTFGRLMISPERKLLFCYHRMGFGPTRRVVLPGDVQYEVGRGLLQPSLIVLEGDDRKHRILFRLLPGYRGSEEVLREALSLRTVYDIRVPSGLRAFWKWLNDSGEVSAGESPRV